MSINEKKNMHERLKLERERLGYTQEEFAHIGGTTRVTQGKYEQGSEPKAGYFSAIHKVGADIFYILTGQRLEGEVLSNDEKFLLDKFRLADKRKQRIVLGMLVMDEDNMLKAAAGELGQGRGSKVFHGDVQNVADGNITIEQQGNINER